MERNSSVLGVTLAGRVRRVFSRHVMTLSQVSLQTLAQALA
jgi:hypothetical protein